MTDDVARKLFLISFIVLALIFVPVKIYYLMGTLTAPCCFLMFAGLFAGAPWDFGSIVFGAVYIAVYLGLFYLIARIAFSLIGKISNPQIRLSLQVLVLLGVFSCSFLRVIVDSGFRGDSGTYNFWTASVRYFDRIHSHD